MTFNMWRMAGLALVALGLILFVVGLNVSNPAFDPGSVDSTGQISAGMVWYIVLGLVAGLPGVILVKYAGNGKGSRIPRRQRHYR